MSQPTVLGGRYLIQDRIGSGGMATVFRAHDQTLDRTVAIKIMLPQYASDPTFAARFKQEAQAAAALSSPYIVSVYDWGKDGDTYFIAMEYLRGTDLKTGIRTHGALDPKKVAQIGSEICGALSVAHKHEIIHRDIKPQNIMVLPDGNIKVMDFGIARAKNSHLTQDNNVLGTAHYVSPEQTRGQELGPTSDLYSLGVVMYECATGQVPFDGDDAISVALKQVNELPVPPSQINPKLDADLERIILKCMEKDPANRFQTADELRQVLNAYLAGRTVHVAEPTRVIGAAGAGETTTQVMPGRGATTAMPRGAGRGVTAQDLTATGSYEQPKKKGTGKIVAAVIAVIAVIAVAVVVASGLLGGGNTVSVPDVLGMTEQEARAELQRAGLDVSGVTEEYNSDYAEGEVCDQNPDANQQVAEGSSVALVISQGADPSESQVQVPSIVGRDETTALEMLAQVGLEGTKVAEEPSDDVAAGSITRCEPGVGNAAQQGDTVQYWVSSGPDSVEIPSVDGYDEDNARRLLENAGFSVTVATEESSSVAEGMAIRTDPTGSAAQGASITLYVSSGSGQVDIPDLTGMTKSQAENALRRAGFSPSFSYADGTSSGTSPDHVISWNPTGSADEGATISVVVAWTQNSSSSGGNSSNSGNSSSSGNSGTSSSGNSGTSTSDPEDSGNSSSSND